MSRCGLRAKVEGGWEGSSVPVPLTSVSVHTKLLNYTAHVTVVQTYVNKEEAPIECDYVFPIEEEAAVVDFKAELEGRELKSQIKEREEAKKDYDAAVEEGRTGFLVDSTRDDMLDIQVGHLSPGAGCKISLSYIFEAPLENGKTRLTVPTTISPKYIPFHEGSPEAKKIATIPYDFKTPAKLEFDLDVCMRSKIEEVTSPSHKLTTEGGSEANSLGFYTSKSRFEGTTAEMDRDIVVLVKCEDPNKSIVFVEESEETKVVMVSIVPKLELKTQPELDVVFLVDCSGSMGGSSIKLAQEAINYLLHSLPPSVNFNIVRFGSRHVKLFSESKPYTDKTLAQAKAAMAKLDADLGGTEILRPLTELLTEKTKVPRRIFVLTDGSVSNSAECIRITKKNNEKNRVFTLGIGSAADRHLVKGLARAGLGTFQFTVEGEKMAPKVLKQLKNCLQPNLQDVKIHWGSEEQYGAFDQVPEPLPPLYNGNRLQIFKIFDKKANVPEKISITATIPSLGESHEETVGVKTSVIHGNLLHQMYARKLIQELTENMNVVDASGKVNETEEKEIKPVIIKTSLKYQLMSKYTSFVAVDSKENKSEKKMVHRSVPAQVPRGFGFAAPAAAFCNAAPQMAMCISPAMPRMVGGGSGPPPPGQLFGSAPVAFGAAPSAPKQRQQMKRCKRSKPVAVTEFDHPMAMDAEMFDVSAMIESNEEDADGFVGHEEKDDLSRVLKLVSLQRADGSFKKDKPIFNIGKLNESELESIRGQLSEDRFYTLLVVLVLEQMFQENKDCWEMVVDKANRWLAANPVPDDVKQNLLNVVKRAC